MKKVMLSAFGLLFVLVQGAHAQAVQQGKAIKKEMKAEKKVAKAEEKRMEARTHKGLEIKGVSDPKTRMKDAERKEAKAEKKELKSDAKLLKASAKALDKKAAKVN
ncbi:hypothetical protein [Fibrella forsythiae]|uniref:Uncharacterized protein n=1 Tax=Fibrella forsythiae TaxID=2817061 RepID=A0ABS3JQH2_9BACT|nr:hypothetical protein [Fibrella forsythiae]MBO0952260.1 hypothetical protein [Fibrella forsythiae]